MKKIQYIFAAAVIMTAASSLSSCKGRHADSTPNGETVEVNVVDVVAETESGTVAVPAESVPVEMEVKVVSPPKENASKK